MKFYALSFVIVSSLVFAGCDNDKKDSPAAPAPQFGNQIEVTGNLKDLPTNFYEEYRFEPRRHQAGNCSTDWRVSLNLDQYCDQLQSDWINNSCAQRRRRQSFNSDCAGRTWDPERTERELQSQPGPHITCYASDPSEDGLEGKRRNPELYENDEHFTDQVSALRYNDFVAFILMDLQDGLFRVKIRAFDTGSGRFLAETQDSWKDQMPTEIMLENLPSRVRVICTPTIR